MTPSPEDSRNWSPRLIKVSWLITACLSLTYVVVASSGEFASYAPLALADTWRLAAFFLAAGLLGWLSDGMKELAIMTAVVVVVPLSIYGSAMVALPVLLGHGAMTDILILWALERMVGHLVVGFVLGTMGAMAGVMLQTFTAGR